MANMSPLFHRESSVWITVIKDTSFRIDAITHMMPAEGDFKSKYRYIGLRTGFAIL